METVIGEKINFLEIFLSVIDHFRNFKKIYTPMPFAIFNLKSSFFILLFSKELSKAQLPEI